MKEQKTKIYLTAGLSAISVARFCLPLFLICLACGAPVASADAKLEFIVVDGIGQKHPASYALLKADGKTRVASNGSKPMTSVPAGKYVISPTRPFLKTHPIALKENEQKTITVQAPDALWLSFRPSPKQETRRLLIQLRPKSERVQVISQLRNPAYFGHLSYPRGEVEPEAKAHALKLARHWFAEGIRELRAPSEEKAKWKRHKLTTNLTCRILAAHGDQTDVERLTQFAKKMDYYSPRWYNVTAAAYIEQRQGRLGRGVFLKTAQGDHSPSAIAAAVLLHHYGIRTADKRLTEFLLSDEKELSAQTAYDVALVLLDTPTPQVLQGMRGLLKRYVESEKGDGAEIQNPYRHVLGPVILYLLTHGEKADWQQIAQLQLSAELATIIAYVSQEPAAIAELLADSHDKQRLGYTLGLTRTILSHPPEHVRRHWQEITDALWYQRYDQALADGETGSLARDKANTRINTLSVMGSAYFPNTTAARFYYTGVDIVLPWAATPLLVDQVVDLLKGEKSVAFRGLRLLDYIPHADLDKRIGRDQGGDTTVPLTQLLLAHHAVAKMERHVSWGGGDLVKGNMLFYSPLTLRRPYLLSHPHKEFSGSLSGVVSLTPTIDSGRLRIGVRLEQAAYYHMLGDLSAKIANNNDKTKWLHHPYVEEPSRLIGQVRIHRGKEKLDMTKTKLRDNEDLAYAAELGKPGLEGLYLELELNYFGQRQWLSYDLFAGESARNLNIENSRKP